jgi:peptide/nickel transport system permease protein
VRWVVKLLALVGVVIIVSILTFLMTDFLPGDPAEVIAGSQASDKEFVDNIRQELNLDDPLPQRYLTWAGNALQGDFGRSLEENDEPIADKLRRTIPNTVQLLLLAEIVSILVAVPIGVYSGYRANGKFDKFATGMAFFLLAIPSFVMGVVLIAIFAVSTNLLKIQFDPISEVGLAASLKTSIMPVICISVGIIAVYVRLLRTDMIATLQEDFILNARAKGLKSSYILFRHALRPSSFSLLTVAGINLGTLIGGSVIVEQLFSINGVGNLLVQSISSRDIATVQVIVLIISITYVGVNFLVDLVYSSLDPRIRRG